MFSLIFGFTLLSVICLDIYYFNLNNSCVADFTLNVENFLNTFWDLWLLFSRFVFVYVSLSAVAQGVYAVEHYTNAIWTIQHSWERYMTNIGVIVYFTCELNGVRVTKNIALLYSSIWYWTIKNHTNNHRAVQCTYMYICMYILYKTIKVHKKETNNLKSAVIATKTKKSEK